MTSIKKFTDIIAWQHAHSFAILVYKTSYTFPKSEQFGVISQIQRASVSVAANIVEGFYRNTPKERLRFYEIAMSSLEEVKYFIILSKDLSYLSIEEARTIYSKANEVGQTLRGWMKSTR